MQEYLLCVHVSKSVHVCRYMYVYIVTVWLCDDYITGDAQCLWAAAQKCGL